MNISSFFIFHCYFVYDNVRQGYVHYRALVHRLLYNFSWKERFDKNCFMFKGKLGSFESSCTKYFITPCQVENFRKVEEDYRVMFFSESFIYGFS